MNSIDSELNNTITTEVAPPIIAWLTSTLYSEHHDTLTDDILINTLAISHLCATLNHALLPAHQQLTEYIITSNRMLKWTDTDLLTSLIALSALAQKNREIISDDAYVDCLVSLSSNKVSSPNQAILFLAFQPAFKNCTTPSPEYYDAALSKEQFPALDHIVSHIETRSLFGNIKIEEPALPLLNSLLGAMVFSFKNDDLSRGLRLLRALKYCDIRCQYGIEQALHLIVNLQCSDGSYGEYDSAIEKFKLQPLSGRHPLSIKYTMTFQVLWTLSQFIDCQTPLRSFLTPLRQAMHPENLSC